MPGGGGGDTTTVQKADPWVGAQPNLYKGLADAKKLYNQGKLSPEAYEGDRVAGFGDTTQAAHGSILDVAGGQQGALDTALSTATGTAMGDGGIYRDLDAVKKSALESVMPSVMSAFGGSGMQDSSTARMEAATAATNAIAPIEYGAYGQAKDRALSAAGMIPGLSQAQYIPSQMMGQVGSSQDAMSQSILDSDIARHYETESRDARALERFSNLSLGYGGLGGSSTRTQSGGGSSGFGQIAGAGLGGLGAYGALAANPITAPFAIGGGILSGLGSLF